MTDGSTSAPPLPPGREVELPGRGTTFVREVAGPPDAPTLRAAPRLDGDARTSTGSRRFASLGRHFRVVVARPPRSRPRHPESSSPFRLEDCADDAVALCDVLGIERFIPVGYSMGGPDRPAGLAPPPGPRGRPRALRHRGRVRRHTRRAAGLRRHGCAGTRLLGSRPGSCRARLSGLYLAAQIPAVRRLGHRAGEPARLAAILEAGRAIGRFSSAAWVGEIDVPTAVVITMRDHVVSVRRQIRLFERHPRRQGLPGRRRPRRLRDQRGPLRADAGHRLHLRRRAGPRGRRRLIAVVARAGAGASRPLRLIGVAGASRVPPAPPRSSCRAAGAPDDHAPATVPPPRRSTSRVVGHRARVAPARNAELARLGARVGRTYASTAARKVFASAPRRRGARPRARAAHRRRHRRPASAR